MQKFEWNVYMYLEATDKRETEVNILFDFINLLIKGQQ